MRDLRGPGTFVAPIRVVGVVPATENMPGGRAIKPGDILKSAEGKTVEGRFGDQEYYTLNDGRCMYVDMEVAAKINLLGLRPGQSIMVEDAIKAIVTKSANDIAVAIGEKLGGDEQTFAEGGANANFGMMFANKITVDCP